MRHWRRVAAGLLSSMTGWLAAWVLSLPFQVPELVRNANAGFLLRHLAGGLGLWTLFTFSACMAVWLVVVLPGSLLLPSRLVRQWRWGIILAGAGCGVYTVGDRLGTWTGLIEGGPLNPLDSVLFWMYSLFGVFYTLVTVERYAARATGEHRR